MLKNTFDKRRSRFISLFALVVVCFIYHFFKVQRRLGFQFDYFRKLSLVFNVKFEFSWKLHSNSLKVKEIFNTSNSDTTHFQSTNMSHMSLEVLDLDFDK